MVWFLARWVATYLVPLDTSMGNIKDTDSEGVVTNGSQPSRKILQSFGWQNNQGDIILDSAIRISLMALTMYPGENELQVCHRRVPYEA